MKELNELSYQIIGCIYKVHSELGPGLLESTYEACLAYELSEEGLFVERQCPLPVIYKGIKLDAGYRIDMIVNKKIILEIKSVEYTAPIHKAQLMTYLKLSSFKLGLLINFNVQDMKKGIDRIIM
jgi:GxxExxY protein